MDKLIVSLLILIISLVSFSAPLVASSLDQVIRDKVQTTDQGAVDSTMSLITKLGDGTVDLAIAGALPDREAKFDAYKSLLVGGLSVITLKSIIGKKRPGGPVTYQHFTLDSKYHAFPSGHTTTAFALATTIARHYPDYKVLSYSLATLVGISRLYEDRHWASDIVAGAGLGYSSAQLVRYNW